MKPWEILLSRIRAARTWPPPSEVRVRRKLKIWAALRENDEPTIRGLMEWPDDRPLILDNLPEKIASAYGDLLYGTPPNFIAANEADQERMTEMTSPWAAELPAAVETNVSEGEVWYRQTTNPALPHPVLTWHSRMDVIPLLYGREVLAVAFVNRLDQQGNDRGVFWRHIELHGVGIVVNLLFRGRATALGEMVALKRHTQTALLPDVWPHGLPVMLAGRVVKKWGRKPDVGVSIYGGVWSRMLGLNEAVTVGRENMRLTAKKRAVVPASALRARGPVRDSDIEDRGDGTMVPVQVAPPRFDAGEDVLVLDPLDVEEGGGGEPPFKVLEYSFDADALIAWLRSEVEFCCQRCDIVPQFVGSGDFGSAPSGTALRVRLLPTTIAAESVGRPWGVAEPQLALNAALLENLPRSLGGCGGNWTEPGGTPICERSDVLPQDETEVANRIATLRTSDAMSAEQAVRVQHPDWDDDAVGREVEAIRSDAAPSLSGV